MKIDIKDFEKEIKTPQHLIAHVIKSCDIAKEIKFWSDEAVVGFVEGCFDEFFKRKYYKKVEAKFEDEETFVKVKPIPKQIQNSYKYFHAVVDKSEDETIKNYNLVSYCMNCVLSSEGMSEVVRGF